MKLVWHFNNKSIRFKLLFYFFVIIILSVLTLTLLGSSIYKKSLQEEATSYTVQMMKQVWNQIESNLNGYDDIIQYLSMDESIQKFMEEEEPISDLEQKVNEKLKIYKESHAEIAGVIAVNKSGLYTSNETFAISRDNLTQEYWYKQAEAAPDRLQLISNPIGRNIKESSDYQVNNLLSAVKAVKDPVTNHVSGVILMDIKLDFIKKVLESIKLGNSGFIFILNRDGSVVYSPVNPIVYRIHPDWLSKDRSHTLEKVINRNIYQIIYNTYPSIKWKVVGVFSLDETTEVVSRVQFYTYIIGVITLLVSSIAAWFFASSIINPVNKLRALMRNVEEGRFDKPFHSKYNDEIGQLGKSYNRMIQEISRLIQLVYTEQKNKREAELKTLQAQIKPHFLYNTLDTIQWMAYEYKAHRIVELINALTTLFRIGLNKGNEFITIEEEIKHVESYLIIQMTRYESKLEYEIHVEEQVKKYKIIKVLLQPLVENAIYHGIRNKRGMGQIFITVKQVETDLVLTVKDTGIGIPPGKTRELNEILQQPNHMEPRQQGYGLFNVNDRIKLMYGTEYRVTIESADTEWTMVHIHLPIQS
ncbi:cache domain-containing sensor histidine kinase [Peribacillus kribbensis]|uniref:cache domain-containing sensor histidine kinase n=1 Tax=Peribacillus kribbensis TaxID=356658 RepID=UPI00042A93B1|nr:sensor histidine kinase [Peribacillus kribbensis]